MDIAFAVTQLISAHGMLFHGSVCKHKMESALVQMVQLPSGITQTPLEEFRG